MYSFIFSSSSSLAQKKVQLRGDDDHDGCHDGDDHDWQGIVVITIACHRRHRSCSCTHEDDDHDHYYDDDDYDWHDGKDSCLP